MTGNLVINGGNVDIIDTGTQLQFGYDVSNYWSSTVASDGGKIWAGVGSDADFALDFTGATDGDFMVNTNNLFVDTSTQSVGVGTSTPTTKLVVHGNGGNTSTVLVSAEGTGNNAFLKLKDSDSGFTWDLQAMSDGKFSIANSTVRRITIDGAGRVGIGTTTPGAKLDVNGSISGSTLRAANLLAPGEVIYSNGTTLQKTSGTSSGKVLLSQGASAPVWKSPVSTMVWYIDSTLAVGTEQGANVIMPFGFTITGIDLKVKTAPTGADIILNIKENGTTIYSTKPRILATTTVKAGTEVLSDTFLAAGSNVTLDIDQIGSIAPGTNLTILLKGVRQY